MKAIWFGMLLALARFTSVLSDSSKSLSDRSDALKFVTHFVGDIHQPLHDETRFSADGKDDHGRNLLPVTFFGQSTNLRTVWDAGIIMHTVFAWGAYVTRLQTGWLNGRDVSSLEGGGPTEWATEAHRFAQDVAYDVAADGALADDYYGKALHVVDRQLALAGVRLAHLLKEALRGADACQ
jgi:hypothetical protein